MDLVKILLLSTKDLFDEFSAQVIAYAPIHLIHADSLESALEAARKERPELILLTSGPSGLDAFAGCAAFKDDDELRTIPVVVLASESGMDTGRLSKAGSDGCLIEPLDSKGFFSCLRKYVPSLDLLKERVPCYSQVTIRDENDLYYGMTGDISGGGLFVAALDTLPEKGEIQLSFSLPDDKATLVETMGRVAWYNSRNHPVSHLPEGFGVEFTSITRDEYLAIKEYIASIRQNRGPE
ncbi:MAG: PilZ domain-containing protein [Desulfobacteraceae bacterium]|nr:PilZ domain-containing protein [Desulfobacteraceae bacterium]